MSHRGSSPKKLPEPAILAKGSKEVRLLIAQLRSANPSIEEVLALLDTIRPSGGDSGAILAASERKDGGARWIEVLAKEARVIPMEREDHVRLLKNVIAAIPGELANILGQASVARLDAFDPDGKKYFLTRAFLSSGEAKSRAAFPEQLLVRSELLMRQLGWFFSNFRMKYGLAALIAQLPDEAAFPGLSKRLVAVTLAYEEFVCKRKPMVTHDCPICQEEVKPQKNAKFACGHGTHLKCARMLRSPRCPLCKMELTPRNSELGESEIAEIQGRGKADASDRQDASTLEFLANEQLPPRPVEDFGEDFGGEDFGDAPEEDIGGRLLGLEMVADFLQRHNFPGEPAEPAVGSEEYERVLNMAVSLLMDDPQLAGGENLVWRLRELFPLYSSAFLRRIRDAAREVI